MCCIFMCTVDFIVPCVNLVFVTVISLLACTLYICIYTIGITLSLLLFVVDIHMFMFPSVDVSHVQLVVF